MNDPINIVLKLDELAYEGVDLNFTKATGELDEFMKPILGKDSDYQIKISIKPAGNVFSVIGHFAVKMDLNCSRCGIDVQQPVSKKINEIIMVEENSKEIDETSHQHKLEDIEAEQFCSHITTYKLHLGQYLSEIIGLEEPNQVYGRKDCNDSCPNLIEAKKQGWLDAIDVNETIGNSPFSVLDQLRK